MRLPPGAPPGTTSPRLTKKTVELFTVLGSMAPSKGISSRVCALKPSSRFMTSMSSQSDGLTLQSGFGRLTRSAVFWPESETVKKSLGNGDWCIPDTLNSGVTDGVGGGGLELL